MSELLDWVVNCGWLEEAHRIDPHVLCKASRGREAFWFIASDDNWYGWFIAQYERTLSPEQLDEAVRLIRRIGPRRAHCFHFDWRDDVGLLRGVLQLPIANEPRWEDDVPSAIYTLEEEWGTLLSFLRRIAAGEKTEGMIVEAKIAFAEIDARHSMADVPGILARHDPCART